MSTHDAPDFQTVVVVVSGGTPTDTPDWERQVTGPGGSPLNPGLGFLEYNLSGPVTVGTASSTIMTTASLITGNYLVTLSVNATITAADVLYVYVGAGTATISNTAPLIVIGSVTSASANTTTVLTNQLVYTVTAGGTLKAVANMKNGSNGVLDSNTEPYTQTSLTVVGPL